MAAATVHMQPDEGAHALAFGLSTRAAGVTQASPKIGEEHRPGPRSRWIQALAKCRRTQRNICHIVGVFGD